LIKFKFQAARRHRRRAAFFLNRAGNNRPVNDGLLLETAGAIFEPQ
jgi:hypothetical protein